MYKILAKLPFKTNHVHYLPSCHSTNEVAQNLLQGKAEEGTLVITDNQFAGKGQRGNLWVSEPGKNLTFSLILKPSFLRPNEQFLITVAVSLAIKDVLEDNIDQEVNVKWPNDIFVKNKKIAGLLIENVLRGQTFDSCIIGLGLNVNQVEFADNLPATSMKKECRQDFDLNKVLNFLIENTANYYSRIKEGEGNLIKKAYHQAMLGLGEERQFVDENGAFTGIITGTDEFGRLLIKKDDDLLVFQHKEVQMLF